jgi:hypothetical protein
MVKNFVKTLKILITFALIFQFIGCGTILYPERKGQKSGRIDPGIAVLDAIGLLFFFVPGVIAFAIDFSNGTIYLPGTARSSLDMGDIRQVKFDPERSSMANIERIIKKETGYDVDLDQDDVQISELKSTDDMIVRFAAVLPTLKSAPITVSMN